MFQDSEFYRFGNAEAHLTPLTEVVAPALTWHMAFLIAPSEEQKKDESNAENLLHIVKEQIKTKIDEIVIKMIKAIRKNEENRDVFIDPCIESTSILFSRYVNKESLAPLLVQESSCDAAGHGRVDHDSGEKPRDNLFEADNRVLNFSFKWHSREWKNPKINVCINMFSYYFTISVFAEVCDSIVSSCKLEMPSETQKQCVFLKSFEDLTNRFWEDYRKFLTELDGMDATFTNEFLQVIFADFRGVVISDETIKFKEGGDIDKTFDWAEEIIDDLRPIVTQNDSFECAANYVAQRRAIYLTALGPQLLNDPPSLSDDVKGSGKAKPRIPLTYLFCVAPSYQFSDQTVRSRELGRLLDLMHHVGTLRLAALIDLKLLRKASEKLRGIDIYTTIARAAIEDYANEKSNPVEMDQKIDKARSEFVKIAQDFFKYNQAGVGLTFRIESSGFYQSQFEKNVKALGLSSIRGYQKHDDFIARRLGQTFEFISRLGTRYERTVRVIRSLDQSASAIRAATTGETVAKTNISVEKIQRDGAAVLFMVLVPYYLQGSYHYFTHLERFEQIGFIPIILLSLSLAAFQTEKGQNLLKRKGSTVVYFNTFICIVLITLIFAAWVPKNGLKHEGNTPSSLTPEQFRPAPAPAGNLEH